MSINSPSRYVVGIDLGTTNSAVGYADTTDARLVVHTFLVPQIVASGQVERRETLPSFHYQPAEGELPAGALAVPWGKSPKYAVGAFARDQGVRAPGRLISSAKSWMSHPGVDRTADLLPWHGAPDVDRLSPVEASARYLAHIRAAWNHAHPNEPLERQDVVLTLPASFDEVARELTVRAAQKAGLPRVVLIEEPQAAFYAWINKHRDDWQTRVDAGQTILVCDIGGGTSDFTLIRARRGEGNNVAFHRVAVGEHLILGGDNLDLAIAKHLESELTNGGKLDARAWESLVRQSRTVKETLLAADAPATLTVNLAGRGAGLIGGAMQVTVERDRIRELILDGFLPQTSLETKPQARQSGFQEFGLPYAADPAITRHLAAFLTSHRDVLADERERDSTTDPSRPDAVLFNGGFFSSPILQSRLLDVLGGWFAHDTATYEPTVLDHDQLYLAVAKGATYYGLVRRGHGVRITAGLARTYYVGVEARGERPEARVEQPEPLNPQPSTLDSRLVAVCLVPAGAEAGQVVELQQPSFLLRVSEPIELPIFTSAVRLTDKPGTQIEIDREQLSALPPIRTVLRSRKSGEDVIPVHLVAGLSEVGTLDLSCHEVDGNRSWRLQFDVRSATQTDVAAHESGAEAEGVLDEAVWHECKAIIQSVWGARVESRESRVEGSKAISQLSTLNLQPSTNPADVMKRLTATIGSPRDDWPTSLLRRMWELLLELESGRRKSVAHEVRWLNLTGFALRPGYGYALDDWRVSETWKTLRNRLAHAKPESVAQWRIFWRRLAGGLEAGQQQTLADPMLSELRGAKAGGKGLDLAGLGEVFRLLASLERLGVDRKIDVGRAAAAWFAAERAANLRPTLAWSLGRVAARVPLYGPLNAVVPPEEARPWLDLLLKSDLPASDLVFAVTQIARKTDDRFRDLPDRVRGRVIGWLEGHDAAPHLVRLVREGGRLDAEERSAAFGESLPKGLRLG
ncbi:MAG: hsp70 family protein [Planctomycetota bacterium]|nr:hsp70 family protein [Planctomycetota bacterium]